MQFKRARAAIRIAAVSVSIVVVQQHAIATTSTVTATNISLIESNSTGQPASIPYPINFSFSGFSSPATAFSLAFSFSHTNLQDLDMMLVSPAGTGYIFMSDCFSPNGSGQYIFNIADNGTLAMPNNGQPLQGTTYLPTNRQTGDTFAAPAPSSPLSAPSTGGSFASAFAGSAVNGNWKLYIVDDTPGNNSNGLLTSVGLTITDTALAADKYWDLNGNASGVGGAGPATWDTSSSNWNTSSLGTNAPTTFTQADTAIFSGTSGIVNVAAAGVTVDGGVRFLSNGYTINTAGAGPLVLGTTPTVEVQVDSNLLPYTATINAPIAGTGGLTKTGGGALVLNADNAFSGGVRINGGALVISRDTSLGSPSNGVDFTGPQAFLVVTDNITTNRSITASGGGATGAYISVAAGKRLTLTTSILCDPVITGLGTLQVNQNPNIGRGGLVFQNAGKFDTGVSTFSITGAGIFADNSTTQGSAEIFGHLNMGNTAKQIDLLATGSITPGVIIHADITTGAGGLITKTGGISNLLLDGANVNMAGGLKIGRIFDGVNSTDDGGTLTVSSKTAAGTGSLEIAYGTFASTSPLTGANALPASMSLVISGGAVGGAAALSGGNMEFLGPTRLFNPSNSALAAYQHRLNVYNTATLSGALTTSLGPGTATGLTIGGTGTLVIANQSNDFNLPISVADTAHLAIFGSMTSPSIQFTVNSGATLAGPASIAGQVHVQPGGTFAPGNSPGIASVGTLTLDSGSTLEIEIGGLTPGTGPGFHDQVIITNSVTLGGANLAVLDFGGFLAGNVLSNGTTFVIMQIPGNAPPPGRGEFANLSNLSVFQAAGESFQIDYSGGDGNDISLVVVPEPGMFTSFLIVSLGLHSRRRRRS